MKSKRLLLLAIFLIAGSISMQLAAQENLKALVQKCENMQDVDVNIVRNRNKKTRKVEKVITSISFQNNETIVKEIIAAFDRDKEMADQEIENRSNGRVNNLFYRFGSTSYSFSEDGTGSGSLSVIEKGND